jgi:predicted permease
MTNWRRWFSRNKKWEQDMQDELRFHLERQIAANISAGLAPEEARRQAALQLGAIEGVKEDCREQRSGFWLESLYADVRYALRILRKAPGFTTIAILTLALGIGANTAIFTLAKEALLDQLGVPHPGELRLLSWSAGPNPPIHSVWGDYDQSAGGVTSSSFSYPAYLQLRRDNQVLQDLFAFKDLGRLNVTIDGQAEVVRGQFVSGNFYQQLQVVPALGRPIEPADDAVPGGGPVAVISDAFWARRFGRTPSVIGRKIQLSLTPVTIVGVNPPRFTGAANVQMSPDVFVPFSIQPILLPRGKGSILNNPDQWWLQIMGRLKPDVPQEKARASLDVVLTQVIKSTMTMTKDEVPPQLVLRDGSRGLNFPGKHLASPMYVLLSLAALLLLLSCANLANLLLARTAARRREMSVRLALGAGMGRILRQIATESLLLSFFGGIAGLLLAFLGRNAIPWLLSTSWEPSPFVTRFDGGVFAFAAAASLLTGLLFGLAPAWQATRMDVSSSLKDSAATVTKRRKGLTGKSIVVFQVCLSVLLVMSSALFIRTLMNLSSSKLGFQPSQILLFDIDPPRSRYPAPKDIALHRQLEEGFASVPGIDSVTLSGAALVAGDTSLTDFVPNEQPRKSADAQTAYVNNVGESFFTTMGIPIMSGRGFNSGDTPTSPKVAVVNQSLAREYFPHSNPIGTTFNKEHFQIVGICGDAKYSDVRTEPPPTFYYPYRQGEDAGHMTFEVRTKAEPASIVSAIREVVQSVDKDLPLIDLRTQSEQIAETMQTERIFAVLSGAFGVLALVLASIGVYGVMAYAVSRRTNEIGIRMALGAQPRTIGRMVLGETLTLMLAGIFFGLLLGWAAGRLIDSLLFGISAHDPVTLAAVAAVLVLVGVLAGYSPARRATRVDPMVALRHE